jgi:leader peptidase (prepilin peptidase) / N-methyltransferase
MSAKTVTAVAGTSDVDPGLVRRPMIVMPVAAVLVILAFASFAAERALIAAVLAAVLVLLSAIDIERGIIPNRIVLPAAGVVLMLQLVFFPGHAPECAVAAIAGALVLGVPHLLGRSWVGMGDVKLALLLGAGLGWAAFGAMLLAFVCIFPVAVLVLIRQGMGARKATLPFGPFLSLGALIVLFTSQGALG